jgi:hypothetical protein
MSRVRSIGVGVALALFVYVGAMATNTRVEALSTIVQGALEVDMAWEWFDGEWFVGFGPGFLAIPAALMLALLLCGGLPLAGLSFLIETRQGRPPYWCLPFQIVSCGLSSLLLALYIPALFYGGVDLANPDDWALVSFLGYLGFQLIMGIIAIPVWRRLVVYAPRESVLQT